MFKTTKLTSFNVHLKSSKDVTNYDGCITSTSCDSPHIKYLIWGFIRNTYRGIVSLKNYNNCEYTIAYSDTSRDEGITTGSAGQSFYVSAFLNKCQANSSPVFDSFPQFIVGEDNCIDLKNSATDPEGDSIVYMLDSAMQDAGKAVSLNKPYTYDKPLYFNFFPRDTTSWDPPSCGGFHLDSSTGFLNFSPKKMETSVIAIRIEKWRSISGLYIKIGEITRDIEIVVGRFPPSHPPTLSGINGTANNAIHIHPNHHIHMTVNSDDPDKSDTVTLSWTTDMPGDTISFEAKRQHPTLFIDWTPLSVDIRSNPYVIFITAKDNSCQALKTTRALLVYVDSNSTTGIESYSISEDELKIFPNPSSNDFTVSYSLNQNAKVLLEVYDVLGHKISTLVSEPQSQGLYKTKFDGSQATDGIYILKGKIGDRFVERRMVLMK